MTIDCVHGKPFVLFEGDPVIISHDNWKDFDKNIPFQWESWHCTDNASGTIQNSMTSGDIVQGVFLLFSLMVLLWIALVISIRRVKLEYNQK